MAKKIDSITIGELVKIKKITHMTLKAGILEARKLRDKHGLTDKETLGLIGTAKNFQY